MPDPRPRSQKLAATERDDVRIAFSFALPPEQNRPPKDEAVVIPSELMRLVTLTPPSDQLNISEFFLLQFLLWETYGEYRLELQLSYAELSAQARRAFEGRTGTSTVHRGLSKPRIARALRKFERLGYLTLCAPRPVLRLVACGASDHAPPGTNPALPPIPTERPPVPSA